EADSLYAILHAHQSAEAPPLDRVRPEVPAALAAVVAKMMAKDVARRYQKPAQVAQALAPFFKPRAAEPPAAGAGPPGGAGGPSMASPESGTAGESTLRTRAAPRKWRLAAAVVVGVLACGLAGLWADGVFRVKTAQGTLVPEGLPADTEVTVDGEKATLQ